MDEMERKALALASECAGRKLHHYERMGDELPLRWSIEAHADTIMQYKALQAERDALEAEIARLRRDHAALAKQLDITQRKLKGVTKLWHSDRGAALAQETQP
jgi:hypothetical protein